MARVQVVPKDLPDSAPNDLLYLPHHGPQPSDTLLNASLKGHHFVCPFTRAGFMNMPSKQRQTDAHATLRFIPL